MFKEKWYVCVLLIVYEKHNPLSDTNNQIQIMCKSAIPCRFCNSAGTIVWKPLLHYWLIPRNVATFSDHFNMQCHLNATVNVGWGPSYISQRGFDYRPWFINTIISMTSKSRLIVWSSNSPIIGIRFSVKDKRDSQTTDLIHYWLKQRKTDRMHPSVLLFT